MMRELGLPITIETIAHHYRDLLDGLVVDEADQQSAQQLSIATRATRTLMLTLQDRDRLAQETLAFAAELRA